MTQALNSLGTSRIGRLLITPVLLAWLGCSDATDAVAPARETVTAAVAQGPTPVAAAEIEDVLNRVLPAMGDGAGSKGLETALGALLEALASGAPGAAVVSLESAERALEGFSRAAGHAGGDAVHIDVIGLALASVRSRVEGR